MTARAPITNEKITAVIRAEPLRFSLVTGFDRNEVDSFMAGRVEGYCLVEVPHEEAGGNNVVRGVSGDDFLQQFGVDLNTLGFG